MLLEWHENQVDTTHNITHTHTRQALEEKRRRETSPVTFPIWKLASGGVGAFPVLLELKACMRETRRGNLASKRARETCSQSVSWICCEKLRCVGAVGFLSVVLLTLKLLCSKGERKKIRRDRCLSDICKFCLSWRENISHSRVSLFDVRNTRIPRARKKRLCDSRKKFYTCAQHLIRDKLLHTYYVFFFASCVIIMSSPQSHHHYRVSKGLCDRNCFNCLSRVYDTFRSFRSFHWNQNKASSREWTILIVLRYLSALTAGDHSLWVHVIFYYSLIGILFMWRYFQIIIYYKRKNFRTWRNFLVRNNSRILV